MAVRSVATHARPIENVRHRRSDDRSPWSLHSLYLGLRRRGVIEAGTNYIVVAWLIAQVAELIGEIFGAPGWMLQALLVALALGLPIALFVSWAFELTPDGFKRDREPNPNDAPVKRSGQGVVCALIAILVLTIGALAVNRPASVCTSEQTTAEDSDAQEFVDSTFTIVRNQPDLL
jgi:hypothetical protein